MKIAVASGKGGTGKTTVAVNLALSLGNVQLLDCDVDEPDCHLFLDLNLEEIEDVKVPLPVIDEKRCDLCGDCAELCYLNAIVVTPKGVMVFPELCNGCGLCMFGCPQDAISEVERTIGKVEKGNGEVEFYQGTLTTGEALASPIINAVKAKIDDRKTTIIDAPPGNSCFVAETIEGTDFCILVTEPTPFGLHDLKLSEKLLSELGVPYAVVINKAGMGDDRVEKYCEKKRIPILMSIPHDSEIMSLYSKGIPFVKKMPEWREKFANLYERIEEMIS